jgi:ABC-2 type transport system permease protein
VVGLGDSTLATQTWSIARRSTLQVLRQPALLIALLAFPLFMLTVNVSNLGRLVRLSSFPTRSYLSFALAFPLVQGALYTVVGTGTNIAQDIESGFLSRLALTRVRRPALLFGLLAGAILIALIQSLTYLLVGLAAGAKLTTGVPGLLAIVALAVLMGIGFGAFGLFLALRTGSSAAVQAFLPLLFAALFMSSMNLPRSLIQTAWFRDVATYNPVSYLIEAIRSLMISGWDGAALARGFGIAGAIALLAVAAAASALRVRVLR